jgi:hypothetical protein
MSVASALGCETGGSDPTWRDHAIGELCTFAAIGLFDVIILQRLFTNKSARWFALHSAFNWAIVFLSARDVYSVFSAPLCSLSRPMDAATWTGIHTVFAGHLYHAVAFDLKPQEVRHHLVFAGVGAAITLSLPWGPLMGLCAFIMCGLPGGIDYGLLSAVKTGHVTQLREKHCNMLLHTWIRIPGLVFVGSVAFACLMHGTSTRLNTPLLVVAIALNLLNGLHYGQQIIGNFYSKAGTAENKGHAASDY